MGTPKGFWTPMPKTWTFRATVGAQGVPELLYLWNNRVLSSGHGGPPRAIKPRSAYEYTIVARL